MIEDAHFSLDLGNGWRPTVADCPDRYSFRDDARDLDATLSGRAVDVPADALDSFARTLVERRMNAEAAAAFAIDRETTIYEPIVMPFAWGRAVAYFGHDDGGRQFGYTGMVTLRSAIDLHMSSGRLSERELMEAMDDLGSRIAFDRTPVRRVLDPTAPSTGGLAN